MAKSLSNVDIRAGSTIRIGDNRYGDVPGYTDDMTIEEKIKRGDVQKVVEVRNPLQKDVMR